MSRVEDDQKEDSSLKDELEAEATGRLIGEGIDAVIDHDGRASRGRTRENATEEGKLESEDDEVRGVGKGECETEGETSGTGTDDLLDGVVGEDGGDLGIGDLIGEVGGFVDF